MASAFVAPGPSSRAIPASRRGHQCRDSDQINWQYTYNITLYMHAISILHGVCSRMFSTCVLHVAGVWRSPHMYTHTCTCTENTLSLVIIMLHRVEDNASPSPAEEPRERYNHICSCKCKTTHTHTRHIHVHINAHVCHDYQCICNSHITECNTAVIHHP